ncbi:helix-turn-helix domain-containing protein [Halomonas sp. QX-2]|jgi:DNA-binding transcriptional MerR regulator|uniref:Helix-turn-helix domain-containing protein n=1 Tax=Vreelandella sedimenti TaxID=2729618 RepID=A0A7Z0N683_9GAMM|nr:helix-turn-helix domain-containing protein [Halomonas sedimenti]NYT72389.1 helix-turn-helix domain-containing protein [Halomonas sedimenti]|tara:strand:+ start:3814 stop:4293 length:480 start_codon:yes stop_codon:yes gene_type:complete
MKDQNPELATTERYIGIGELARESGCKPETVRYYEQIGLLPSAPRNEGNQRRYTTASIRRLTFIRHARDFGFSVEAVRELLQMADYPDMPCEEIDRLAKRHLAEVEARLARLTSVRDELKRMINQCAGGSVGQCYIIDVLSDHRLCHQTGPHGGADVIG